jgi:glycosyltransferase involved in cell wall biosynthesis
MSTVLHISNTDISTDSRIRKELESLGVLPNVQLHVIGVPDKLASGDTEIDGARYRQLPIRSRSLARLPRAIRYFLELIEFTGRAVLHGKRVNADVVHCHDTFALPAGWLLKKICGSKLVYDAHELESNKNGQNSALSAATLLIERACWRQIDLLVSVSKSITDWYMKHLGSKPSVLVLNAPVVAKPVKPDENSARTNRYFHQRYGIPTDHVVFIYLGILGSGRGIELCLDAFASGSPMAHAVFMGYGPLEKKINEMSGRNPNIHLHPAVPHDEVVSLVASADYGLCLVENVSLSDYYCLPNKLFEYCFARVPVLASRFPEISSLVERFSLGICCDPDPSSVREAILHIVDTRPSYSAKDISSLGWDAQARLLTEAYKHKLLIGQNSCPVT